MIRRRWRRNGETEIGKISNTFPIVVGEVMECIDQFTVFNELLARLSYGLLSLTTWWVGERERHHVSLDAGGCRDVKVS